MALLGGILPVLSTPFDARDDVDFDALGSEIDWLLAIGADGVTVAMVSEILRLDADERRRVGEFVVEAVAGRASVVLSAGAESTKQSVRLAEHAATVGATAIMVNPPLNTMADSRSLTTYFRTVADATGEFPIIVQDASGYVGAPIPLDVLVGLLDEFGPVKIQFKPEAEPLGPRLTELLRATDGTARVFEGSGGRNLIESHRRGIVGTMPGSDLVFAIVAIWRAIESGDAEAAYRVQEGVVPILSLVASLDSYVAVEKHLLRLQGVFPSARQRGPVQYTLDDMAVAELERLFARLTLIVSGLETADARRA
ncbi:MAG: dihydrodipicolinate synthase family protein [Microbacterium sp.]|nr:dihydrodipicolinate synthase family protein [Microbacterium sp.]